MANVDKKSKTVRGMVKKFEHTAFDSWACDNRDGKVGFCNHISISSHMHFFSFPSTDPRLSNHDTPLQFPADNTFRNTHLGIHVSFSEEEIYQEFMRSAVVKLWVGDKPILDLHGSLLAQKPPAVSIPEGYDEINRGLLYWFEIEKHILIPPRQPFYVELLIDYNLQQQLLGVSDTSGEFGMIRILLKGIRTRTVFEDDLTEEDLKNLARQHEDVMSQITREREENDKKQSANTTKYFDDLSFMINHVCRSDITPEKLSAAFELYNKQEQAPYYIGGGGFPGGVPSNPSLAFGVVDPLEVGKNARGFSEKDSPAIDFDVLESNARRIARERLIEGKTLDEEYRQEVARSVGIEDYKSADKKNQ